MIVLNDQSAHPPVQFCVAVEMCLEKELAFNKFRIKVGDKLIKISSLD